MYDVSWSLVCDRAQGSCIINNVVSVDTVCFNVFDITFCSMAAIITWLRGRGGPFMWSAKICVVLN